MKHSISKISPAALNRKMKAGAEIVLLDVRSPTEFFSGHIPGARLIPLDDLRQRPQEFIKDLRLRPYESLYLACHSGARADEAAQLMDKAGAQNLVTVTGGTLAWEQEGMPLKRYGAAMSLERQVQIAVGSLLILKVFFGFTVHELFFVLGAVIGAGLITSGITRWCGMAKLIARMPWNHQRDCNQQA